MSEKYTYTLPIPPSCHDYEKSPDSCNEKIPCFIAAKTVDEKWEILSSMKKIILKHQLALFMIHAYDYEEAKTYIKRSIKKVMQTVIDLNDVQLLDDTLALGYVTEKNFYDISDYANEKQGGEYLEIKAKLIARRAANLPEYDIEKALKL